MPLVLLGGKVRPTQWVIPELAVRWLGVHLPDRFVRGRLHIFRCILFDHRQHLAAPAEIKARLQMLAAPLKPVISVNPEAGLCLLQARMNTLKEKVKLIINIKREILVWDCARYLP